jgi:hypothetical protein
MIYIIVKYRDEPDISRARLESRNLLCLIL